MAENKTSQLQIRVTRAQKGEIKARARAAGMDLSRWVLSKLLPPAEREFHALLRKAAESDADRRFHLAELNDFLTKSSKPTLMEALREAPTYPLDPELLNYAAGMIEIACVGRKIAIPDWVQRYRPQVAPYFASNLKSLRLHLLLSSPVALRRRNIFADSSVGDRK